MRLVPPSPHVACVGLKPSPNNNPVAQCGKLRSLDAQALHGGAAPAGATPNEGVQGGAPRRPPCFSQCPPARPDSPSFLRRAALPRPSLARERRAPLCCMAGDRGCPCPHRSAGTFFSPGTGMCVRPWPSRCRKSSSTALAARTPRAWLGTGRRQRQTPARRALTDHHHRREEARARRRLNPRAARARTDGARPADIYLGRRATCRVKDAHHPCVRVSCP